MNRLKEKNINDKIDLSCYKNILKNVDDLVLKELVRILNNGLNKGLIDYANENNVRDNERLEFLGDSVLSGGYAV